MRNENTNKKHFKGSLQVFNRDFFRHFSGCFKFSPLPLPFLNFRKSAILLSFFILMSCGTSKNYKASNWKLRFLDEYIIPHNLVVDQTKVGGLSDLDFDGKYFYAVTDIPSAPQIYKMDIKIENNQIQKVDFPEVIHVNRSDAMSKDLVWDLEGLVFDREKGKFIVSSEGSVARGKDPFIVELNPEGIPQDFYELPDYFKSSTKKSLRNNGVFEGLTQSYDQKGIWASTELPMFRDGGTSRIYHVNSPIRVTLFDQESKQAEFQFTYLPDRIRKIPLLPFAWHGVSAILNVDQRQFIFVERTFSAGHGSKSHRVRIFEVDAREATNTLEIQKLRRKINKSVAPAKKKLLLDLKDIKKELTHQIIDNIEGISFGPRLSNGNQSLILISDNNFSSWIDQLNQIILLELIPPKN